MLTLCTACYVHNQLVTAENAFCTNLGLPMKIIGQKAVGVWVDSKTKDLFVKFSDGKVKRLNMAEALEGFENTWAGEILNPDIFEKVTIKTGMPTWPNGFDFDTDVIYDNGEDASYATKIAGSKKS